MNAYIYQSALLCDGCGRETIRTLANARYPDTGDSDDFPQGPYPDGGGEADTPQHCDQCGEFLENPLTAEGIRCLVEALCRPRATDSPVSEQWAEFYDVPMSGYQWNRFDIAAGWYCALTDCHGGQWSRGYERLCKLRRHYTPSRSCETWGGLNCNALGIYIAACRKLLTKKG